MSKIRRVLFSIFVISVLITGCGTDEPSKQAPTETTGDISEATSIPEEAEKETPEDTWTRFYGGIGDDNLSSILSTDDGGLYLIGGANVEYEPERHGDIYLIHIDSSGEVIWEKTFGPDKFGQSITYTADGKLLIAGMTLSEETGMDHYLLKVDLEGNELWSKTISGPMDEWVNTIIATTDGGYVLVGNRVDPDDFITNPGAAGYGGFENRSNIMLTKTDGEGEVVWTHIFESEENTISAKGVQTPDGGYAVLASILYYPDMGDDQLLLKVDENGEEVWSYTWEEGRANGRDLLLTSDGNLLLISLYSASGDPREGDADLMITKMSEDGDILWATTFGEPEVIEMGSAICETKDGDYIIVFDRTADLYNSPSEVVLMKLDANGEVAWEKVVTSGQHFMIRSVLEHPDGGYLMAASSYEGERADILVIKMDADGNVAE
ncbi:MAG: PQQ-binding-like beta-propeller repeat protein [Anaerolineales bacterium]|jgi:outer membrane protein assembly factor BamB